MRYLLITYVKRANGQIDEQVGVAKKLREKDITMCNIIMDFKEKKVEKCIIEGTNMNSDWEKLYGYYQPLYSSVIERLEAEAAQE